MKNAIFIVEDDDSIRGLYEIAFPANEFSVSTFVSAEEMFQHLEDYICDLIILDLMLPGMDGLSALAKLKKNDRTRDIPVIIVSAKGDEDNKVKGLDLGADDYLSKPFGMLELVARVKANLRKANTNKVEDKILTYGDVLINDDEHIVLVNNQPITLTLKEYKLLQLLMSNPEKVVERETILKIVWGYEYFGETRTLDMHIKSLRSKIGAYSDNVCISTVRGVGYKFSKNEKQDII